MSITTSDLTTFLDNHFPTKLSQPSESFVNQLKANSEYIVRKYSYERSDAQEKALKARAYMKVGYLKQAVSTARKAILDKQVGIEIARIMKYKEPVKRLEVFNGGPVFDAIVDDAKGSADKIWNDFFGKKMKGVGILRYAIL